MPLYQPSPRLSHLLSKLVDDSLSVEEARELEEQLLHEAEARDYYRTYLAVHSELSEISQTGTEHSTVQRMPRRRAYRMGAFAAAALLLLSAPLAWFSFTKRPRPTPLSDNLPPIIDVPNVAVISGVHNVQWSLPTPPVPSLPIPAGPLKVLSGELTLTLSSGPMLMVKGPAELELKEGSEFVLRAGQAAFRVRPQETPFIVHMPQSAVVNHGAEFAINATDQGLADVHVLQNTVVVSTVQGSDRSREDVTLSRGETVRISDETLFPITKRAHEFLPMPEVPFPAASNAAEKYAHTIQASAPMAYWRFENLNEKRLIPNEQGGPPLQLHEDGKVIGTAGARFLALNVNDSSGFATTKDGLQGLDTTKGRSVECLLYSTDESYSTAIALEQLAPPSPSSPMRHAPQVFLLERMKRNGDNIGHVHPDYAIRNLHRSPAGYTGGKNTYSSESNLIYRWVHVVSTSNGTDLRLYIDGKLSDQLKANLVFQNAVLRPIIGRLQPNRLDEQRQWIGGIDEVAIYDRVLTPEEILVHFSALRR